MTADEHLLVCLAEECAEISEACSRVAIRVAKLLRFGRDEVQAGQLHTNLQRLAAELADLLGVVETLEETGVVTRAAVERKKSRLAEYMEYARRCETIA